MPFPTSDRRLECLQINSGVYPSQKYKWRAELFYSEQLSTFNVFIRYTLGIRSSSSCRQMLPFSIFSSNNIKKDYRELVNLDNRIREFVSLIKSTSWTTSPHSRHLDQPFIASCGTRFGPLNEHFPCISRPFKNYGGKLQRIWVNDLTTPQCLFTLRQSHITSAHVRKTRVFTI